MKNNNIKEQLKQINLNDLLSNHIGQKIQHITNTATFYLCPFHQEKSPSFNVFVGKDGEYKYKCLGCGKGGDIISFMMDFKKINYGQAMDELKQLFSFSRGVENYTPYPINKKVEHEIPRSLKKDTRVIKKIQKLKNKALINYLESRKIYSYYDLEELYYQAKLKNGNIVNMFTVAFKNNSDGYETNNWDGKNKRSFKSAFGTKDITTIYNAPNLRSVKIFEGFIDYFSYLSIAPDSKINNFIVLNSVALSHVGIREIKGKFDEVLLYLDNDKAGSESCELFKNSLNDISVHDQSKYYRDYKDINEFLVSKSR